MLTNPLALLIIIPSNLVNIIVGGEIMSFVDPSIKNQFESLSVDLKNTILERNVQLHSMKDLMNVLEDIAAGK